MLINTALIRNRLFDDLTLRTRIARDYGLEGEYHDADAFMHAIVFKGDAGPIDNPLAQNLSNADVFRGAVRAIGSNMRNWVHFLQCEERLAQLLDNYNPHTSLTRMRDGDLTVDAIRDCLPGFTRSTDAQAIWEWTHLLGREQNYYDVIKIIGKTICQNCNWDPTNPRLLLCIVAYLNYMPHRGLWEQIDRQGIETPGMGYPLASEFMRNLHWSGFKPDTHIMRLFDRWFPDGRGQTVRDQVKDEVDSLCGLFGRRNKELKSKLTYSLIGIFATPPGESFWYVDSHVWLLGHYVEKKGQETETNYLIEG